jgi:LacI family transcriptional regulator
MPHVTLKEIAAKVGYSKNTVSLALRDDPQLPPATRERIQRVAAEMGYEPNAVISHLMAQLRARHPPRFQAKLALVNANRSADAFRRHPTIPAYVEGCQRRAAKLGYGFDQFWLHSPALKAESWLRVLRARNIKGILLVGLMDTNRLPASLAPVWDALPTVVTGVRTREPALSFSCVDHHNLALTAFEKALLLGYRRPALVLDEVIDRLVECRFSAGFLTGQQTLPVSRRIPAFTHFSDTRKAPALFHAWLKQHQPDALFILYNDVLDWLKARGVRVPGDVAVIQLEWRSTRPQIAGMNQHNDITGEAAVDMLVSQIHHNDRGVPAFPRATLIGATWMEGASAPPRV